MTQRCEQACIQKNLDKLSPTVDNPYGVLPLVLNSALQRSTAERRSVRVIKVVGARIAG